MMTPPSCTEAADTLLLLLPRDGLVPAAGLSCSHDAWSCCRLLLLLLSPASSGSALLLLRSSAGLSVSGPTRHSAAAADGDDDESRSSLRWQLRKRRSAGKCASSSSSDGPPPPPSLLARRQHCSDGGACSGGCARRQGPRGEPGSDGTVMVEGEASGVRPVCAGSEGKTLVVCSRLAPNTARRHTGHKTEVWTSMRLAGGEGCQNC